MATTFDMQPPASKPGAKPQAGFSAEGVPDYMTQTPNAQMPNPAEATYTATEGFQEMATHEGDVGGAGKK